VQPVRSVAARTLLLLCSAQPATVLAAAAAAAADGRQGRGGAVRAQVAAAPPLVRGIALCGRESTGKKVKCVRHFAIKHTRNIVKVSKSRPRSDNGVAHCHANPPI